MKRRDLLKLAAAAPLGLLGQPFAQGASDAQPAAAKLVLKLRPQLGRIYLPRELLEDTPFDLAPLMAASAELLAGNAFLSTFRV